MPCRAAATAISPVSLKSIRIPANQNSTFATPPAKSRKWKVALVAGSGVTVIDIDYPPCIWLTFVARCPDCTVSYPLLLCLGLASSSPALTVEVRLDCRDPVAIEAVRTERAATSAVQSGSDWLTVLFALPVTNIVSFGCGIFHSAGVPSTNDPDIRSLSLHVYSDTTWSACLGLFLADHYPVQH